MCPAMQLSSRQWIKNIR